MRGEDLALAETIRKNLNQVSQSPFIMYINRARPEDVLSNLEKKEIEELLQRAIVIGATKTHTYPRMLKVRDGDSNQYSNPEIGIHYNLYNMTKSIQGIDINISRCLAVTTAAHFENIDVG